jgi:hypothetical protein
VRASGSGRLGVGLLAVVLATAGCGETTIRVTGTPGEERAKGQATEAVQGFWRAFTSGDIRAQCDLSTGRLLALRRAVGETCTGERGDPSLSQGLDVYDSDVAGSRVKVLTGAHDPYTAHRILFTAVRVGGRWKVQSFALLPPRSQGIRR